MSLAGYFQTVSAAGRGGGGLARFTDIVLVAGIVAIIALMIVPLPTWAIDVLVAANIAGGVLLLAIPHLFGAPQPEVHASLAPAAMGEAFIRASLLTNALFWTALGLAAAWLFRRTSVAA